MFTGFLIAITIVCFLLILAIMVQNPKGGGLSSTFGGSQQLGGVQKTTDFLDKSTWTLGGILIALILLSSIAFNNSASGSKVLGDDEVTIPQTEIPATPEAQQQAIEQAPAATEDAAK
ncbi:preprotein translocase subunit SecG [Flavobacterium sp. NRK F10]|uniref:Protein-export membrane protein SecG n=1 Tax=Flavobacterium sediminis TaxID=2201181 RepID=A0A2U8QVI9_9FLAO|nr:MULTISPECIES: preprotein translocase subunit SecG [Flavobacterium]AWM14143.1 preprotein translocase subunit SecG [Flavobacterium sediminis]MCO6175334.1 preprotein translocase subunit SecG [Flavobacterium sp. NRK F10]